MAGFIAPLLIVLTSVPLYLPHSTSHQTGWCLWTQDTSGRDSFINGSCECFDDNANHVYPTSVGAAVSQEIIFEKLTLSIIFILCNLSGSRAASRIQLLYADQLKKKHRCSAWEILYTSTKFKNKNKIIKACSINITILEFWNRRIFEHLGYQNMRMLEY